VTELHDTGIAPRELDPDRPRPIETPWGSFSLFVVDREIHAAQSFCPHLEGPLFQGTVSGEIVMCPWHHWCFSLKTGERVDLAGRLLPSRSRLALCPVSLTSRGTIALGPPSSVRPRS
jgi:nitrite reductase/ring-hydroxylating ferredoxin subunit